MGLLLGLVLGIGLFLIVTCRPGRPRSIISRWQPGVRTARLIAEAGIRGVSVRQLLAVSAFAGALAFLVVLAISAAIPLALAFGLFSGLVPRSVLRRRARVRNAARRDSWPEAVDNLVSGVRAGLSLPEALSSLGVSGPEELRPAFLRFAENHHTTGAFVTSLDRLSDDLADPVGDRVIDALRVAREVGGSDLGNVLRTLSRFLREDARTRGEVEARQSWTVNAARVALAAPWIVLLLLATQSSTIKAYNSPSGALVLLIGGSISYLAYRLMRRMGQLPQEVRLAP